MMKIKESSVISEKKVEIHLLFFMPIFKKVVPKAYINTGTFRKGMSIHFGTVYQSFFSGFKKHIF